MTSAPPPRDPSAKIARSMDEAAATVERAKREGRIVALTNGCFDLIHAGHVTYLTKARAQGDMLVVGLNSDDSVRILKGPPRPIVPERDRAFLLAGLEAVDLVVIFSQPTAEELISALKPQVYVKGGDYTINTINQDERRLVESYGGAIHILGLVPGASTTDIFERIRALCTQALDEPPADCR
jgi:rfaE bifunctional protein nucleotidyltransferase chain/domain